MADQRILIVDDSLTIRRALEVILKPHGYVLEFAEDGQQALERAKSFQPNLILLDFVLPDMRGLDVSSALRRTPTTAEIPVVLVSAKGASIREAYQNAQNVVSYITKPFKPEVVTSVVENALSQAPTRAQTQPTEARPTPSAGVNLEETFSTLLGQLEEAASARKALELQNERDPSRFTKPLQRTLEQLSGIGQHLEDGEIVPLRLADDGSLTNVTTTLLETHRLLCEALVALAATGSPIQNPRPVHDVVIAVPRTSPSHETLTAFCRTRPHTLIIDQDFDCLPWVTHLLQPQIVVGAPAENALLDQILEHLTGPQKRLTFVEADQGGTTTSLHGFETVVGFEQLAAAIAETKEHAKGAQETPEIRLEVVNL